MAGNFWRSIVDMERERLLTAEETLRMTSPSAGRSLDQLAAPFEAGQVAGLALDHLSAVPAPAPYWDALQEAGDAAAFGRQWANMMCAANGPNFFARLDAGRDRAQLTNSLLQHSGLSVQMADGCKAQSSVQRVRSGSDDMKPGTRASYPVALFG